MKKMKQLKKMLSVMLAVVMSLAMMIPVMAAEGEPNANPTKGSITITAGGQGDTQVTLKDKKLVAYKILNATMQKDAITNDDGSTSDGFAYTVPEKLENFYREYFKITETAGKTFDQLVTEAISKLQSDSTELENFAKAALKAAKEAQILGTEKTAATEDAEGTPIPDANRTVVFDNLDLGYYVIEDEGTGTPVSALILDTATPNVSVNLKTSQPVIDKKVNRNTNENEQKKDWQDSNNQAIGKKVEYQLTSKVPDMRGYTKYQFVMVDVLSKGLTFDESTADMAITIAGRKVDGVVNEVLRKGSLDKNGNVVEGDYALLVTNNYKEAAPSKIEGTKIEIVFKDFQQYRDLTGNDITVTYKAELNENAIIGVTGNENNVKLQYSNNPSNNGEGIPDTDRPDENDPKGETGWEEVRTYVTGIEIFKVDGATKVPLKGAEFKIESTEIGTVVVDKVVFNEITDPEFSGQKYWKLKDGSYTLTDPTTEGVNQESYADTEKVYERTTVRTTEGTTENNVYMGTTDESGVLAFDGLKAGTYTITEEKAPQGYNKIGSVK